MIAVLATACSHELADHPQQHVVPVRLIETSSTVEAAGTIRPQVGAEVRVGPRISGLVQELRVQVGDVVERGQVLARLDDSDLRVAVRRSAAALGAAEAGLERLAAERALAEAHYKRQKALLAAGITTPEAAEVAELELEGAIAAIETQQWLVQQKKIDQDEARLYLSWAEIRAPIAGTVTEVATQEGETVAASFAVPTFVTILDLDRLQLEAHVDEVDIAQVHPGQLVDFATDAYPGEQLSGRVVAISPQGIVKGYAVDYVAIIEITTIPDGPLLRPDLTATVTFRSDERLQVTAVPSEAIHRDDEGLPYVLIDGQDGAIRRDISISEISGKMTIVTSGLSVEDRVVLSELSGADVD